MRSEKQLHLSMPNVWQPKHPAKLITLVADTSALVQATPKALVLTRLEDYVTGYARILHALEQQTPLQVFIRHPVIVAWLKNMAARYPENLFGFEVMDARTYLEQLWELSIPEDMTNDEILHSGLLESGITPRAGDTFENVILEYFYDPAFTVAAFSAAHLGEMVCAYDQARWAENTANPLVVRIYQQRLRTWRKKTRDQNTRAILDLIEADIPGLKQALMKYKVLQAYPGVGAKLLGLSFKLFQALTPNLEALDIVETELPDVIQHVTYTLNARKVPENEQEAEAYLRNVSGLLLVEFDHVETFLKTQPPLLSANFLKRLYTVFQPISNRIRKRLERLHAQIPPPMPGKPDPAWSFQEMLPWATEAYLPYFAWADTAGMIDEPLVALADDFACWLYHNWEDLRHNSRHFVFHIFANHAQHFIAPGIVNLVIVIDNLGWRYISLLKGFFQEKGMTNLVAEPYFSMLPTVTEISKKCLLSGEVTSSAAQKRYAEIVEKGWVLFFQDTPFHYLPTLEHFLELRDINDGAYIVNYLPIDTALHQAQHELGLPHAEHIATLLRRLVDELVEFAQQHNLTDKLVIHCTSDHGSTRIPEDLPNTLDPKYFQTADFRPVSHRVASITPERFACLPETFKADCFFLDRSVFGNDQHYLCARRSNRFLAAPVQAYVHGGLSPEEVIVPYLVFRKSTAAVEPLTLFLQKNSFYYRLETLVVELGNPNQERVEQLELRILNANIQVEPYYIDGLDANTQTTCVLHARFKRTQDHTQQESLRFSMTFNCHGVRQHNEISCPIEMKAMATLKDESIFDEF